MDGTREEGARTKSLWVVAMLAVEDKVKLDSNEARIAVLELAVFLNSGVPLTLALQSMMGSEMPSIGHFANGVLRRIESGQPLSRAVEQTSSSLGPVVLSVIRAGEQTGRLARVLTDLSARMDKLHRSRSQLLSALAYPAGILLVTGILVFFMTTYMLPRFLAAAGPALKNPPWPTLLLMRIADAGAPLTLLLLVAICSIPWFLSEVPAATRARNWILYESPLVGTIGRASELARVCADLGLLLDSGMTLDRALKTLCPSDPSITLALDSISKSIRAGETFTEAVAKAPAFPRLFGAFVAVGEETGTLPKLLRAQAALLDADTEFKTTETIQLIEPAALAFLGAVVGFVVLGCFLPIYQLISDNL